MTESEELQIEWLKKNQFKIVGAIGGTILSIIALKTVTKFFESLAYARHGRPVDANTISLGFEQILRLSGAALPVPNSVTLEDILELKRSGSSKVETTTINFDDLLELKEEILDAIKDNTSEETYS